MQITAIILAGGKSKRMGTDKALLKLDEQTLLERLIEKLNPLCSELIISSNFAEHKNYGYPVYEDEVQNCGPIGGISSCLKQSKTNWNLVVSVDAAFVESEFLRFLITQIGKSKVVIPFSERGKEPLIGLYHHSCLPVIETMIKESNFKMHNLFQKVDVEFIDAQKWVEKFPKLFHNLNRPADLCSESDNLL